MRDLTLCVASICFNNLEELKATCRSVDGQTRLPYEHWIIDGSTNRETLDWLTNSPQPAYRKWLHERDNGISDAFNKGIARSKANVIHLLNSGDRYYSNRAIDLSMDAFERNPEIGWTHSLYVQHRGNLDVISGKPFDPALLWRGMRTVAHPTMFVSRQLYQLVGSYNTDLKVAMDFDFLVRIRRQPFRFIDEPLVYFAPGGISQHAFKRGLKEVRDSYRKYVGKSVKLQFWQLRQRVLAAFMKTGAGKAWFKRKNRKELAGAS